MNGAEVLVTVSSPGFSSLRSAVVAVVAMVASTSALAESRFEPRGTGSTFVADDAKPLPHLAAGAQLRFVYDKDPIVRRNKDGLILDTIIAQRFDSQLAVGLGLFDRLELGAQVTGRFQLAPGAGFADVVDGAVLPPPWLSARLLLLDEGWIQTSVRVRGSLFSSIEPGVVVAIDPGWARFTIDTALALTPVPAKSSLSAALSSSASSSPIAVPFAVSARIPVVDHVAVTAEVFGAATPVRSPVEAMLGTRLEFGPLAIVAGVGGGLVADIGTPAVRVIGGLQWRFEPPAPVVVSAPEPLPVEPEAVVVADVDEQGDDAEAAAAEAAAVAALEAAPVPEDEEGADAVAVHAAGVTFNDDVVLFDVDSDRLTLAGRRLLGIVARRIKEREGIEHVVVVGHADALGDPEFNRRLSSWRAQAVRRSLIAWGVPSSLLVVRSVGSKSPVAPNTTAAGRRQNRRVEITFEPAPEQK